MPFNWQGHRYFLFGLSDDTNDLPDGEKTEKWWAVQLDLDGTDVVPLWCRDEPYGHNIQQECLLIGPDKHPFWVRFYPLSKVLRVIDLATGSLALQLTVPVANRLPSSPGAWLVFRMSEDQDIPSVFIFDTAGQQLVQVNLEIAGGQTGAQ